MDVFTPPRAPSMNGSEFGWNPRLLTNNFGDGYSQTMPDGLNAMPWSGTIVFTPLLTTEMTGLANFMREHNGVTFWWLLPWETTPRRWQTLGQPKITSVGGSIWALSMTLTERFDQDTSTAAAIASNTAEIGALATAWNTSPSAGYTQLLASLPTSPGADGTLWNDGGVMTVVTPNGTPGNYSTNLWASTTILSLLNSLPTTAGATGTLWNDGGFIREVV